MGAEDAPVLAATRSDRTEVTVEDESQSYAAGEGISDPSAALLARSQAYCRFAITRPGLYQVMFQANVPDTLTLPAPQAPGRRSFETLVESIARAQWSRGGSKGDPRRLAILLWATLHGLVSLRISRPNFPWPPLEEDVKDAVTRIVGTGRE